MKTLLNTITQDEKKRILEMHKNATKRNYLQEQGSPIPDSKSINYEDMVNYFRFQPIKSTNPNEKPDAKKYETQTNFMKFLQKANNYYLTKKITPDNQNSLTKLFVNEPIIKQLTSSQGITPAKFSEADLDKQYKEYYSAKIAPNISN